MSDITFQIEIPTDNDGYVLMQCPLCGEFFKIKPSDYEDDGVLFKYCPSCGQISDNYLTEDVMELALKKVKNYSNDLIHNELKKMERKYSKGLLKFKAGTKPKHEYESPVEATIEALVVTNFKCCLRQVKIKPLLKITGCHCPFCGVIEYEVE